VAKVPSWMEVQPCKEEVVEVACRSVEFCNDSISACLNSSRHCFLGREEEEIDTLLSLPFTCSSFDVYLNYKIYDFQPLFFYEPDRQACL
jgi:hypothetical protein